MNGDERVLPDENYWNRESSEYPAGWYEPKILGFPATRSKNPWISYNLFP